MKRNKWIIFLLTLTFLFIYLVFKYSYLVGFCEQSDYKCRLEMNQWLFVFSFAPFLFIASIISLLLPNRYFESWLRFAWWGGLVVIGNFVYIHVFATSQPGDMFAGMFDNLIILSAYTFFVLGSLIQLGRTYRARKN